MSVQENSQSSQPAPYGYTATGRISKKPLKSSVTVPEPNSYEAARNTNVKFINCPACYKDFSYQFDPNRAVWKHFQHFGSKDTIHQEPRDTLKSIREWKKPSGKYNIIIDWIYLTNELTILEEERKKQSRIHAANWRERNVRKAKRTSEQFAAKAKIERNLSKI